LSETYSKQDRRQKLNTQKKTLSNVLQELERQIVIGMLRPRERLLAEDLCRKLGISRTLVREVLQRLEGVGLVALTPNRGAVVRDFNPKEIDDLFFVRSTLERAMASLIVERVTSEDLQELSRLNQEFEDACDRKDMAVMILADVNFHRRMSELSGNSFLAKHLHTSRLQTNQISYIAWASKERAQQSCQDHRDMVAALSARDCSALQETLFRHTARGKKDYTEIYSHQYPEVVSESANGAAGAAQT
jgi:DNA-binding GntR family transcriptional regulator